MTTTLKAKFDGRVFVPDEPVNIRAGETVTLNIVVNDEHSEKTPLQRLLEIAEQFDGDPDSPGDAAMQHDHYLYNTPKRDNP
jgi:hypothetical protein